MMSGILCFTHPDDCAIWNRRTFIGLELLGVPGLPKPNQKVTGKKYAELSSTMAEIANDLRAAGIKEANLLTADYCIW